MFTNKDIQELLEYQDSHPALSVYFYNDLINQTPEANKLRLRALLDDLPSDADQDVKRVKEYFDQEFNWKQDRGGVVFSNQSSGFFKAYSLAVEVPTEAHYSHQLMISTLVCLVRSTSGYGVALIDQQKARFLAYEMGALVAETDFQGEEIQRMKHGGGSHPTGRWHGDQGEGDHVDATRNRNLRQAAEAADKFFSKYDIRRVFLGGTETTTAAFRELLSRSWQSLISGEISLNINARPDQVQEKILQLGSDFDDKKKDRLVETVITEAAKGQNGAIRAEDVLGAVREGRVQTLLVDSDFHQEGYRCQGCGYLTSQELESCPFCGDDFIQIDDTREMAVKDVLLAGGNVEIIEDHPQFAEHGGIGALLRY